MAQLPRITASLPSLYHRRISTEPAPRPTEQRDRSRLAGTSLAGTDLTDELLAMFDSLVNVMFCIKGVEGTYLYVNDAFVRRTGRKSKADVIGHTASELFLPELAERYEEQDAEVFATGVSIHNQLELIRNERGDLGWYVTAKSPVRAGRERAADADGTHANESGQVIALVSTSRDLDTPSDHSAAVEPMTRVVDYVNAHLGDRIRVDDLAEVAECSNSQLERRMHKVFGLSATQFVLKRRVDAATQLLADTDLPLADVAARTGFYDQADFGRRFVRLTNETPGSFRAQVRRGHN